MCDWQYLITVYSLYFHSCNCVFHRTKILYVNKVQFIDFFFSFMDGASCAICKKSLPNPRSHGIIVWDFTFKSVVRFKLIFHVVGEEWVKLGCFFICIQLFQYCLLKILSFCTESVLHFCHISFHICMKLSLNLSVLFHCSEHLSLYQYHTILTRVTLQKASSGSPSALFLMLFGSFQFFYFHI